MDGEHEALALCLEMEERPAGPMTEAEAVRYIELTFDERWVDEPDDRRWSDWTGYIEPARQMQVRRTALWVLRKWGGEAAATEFARRLEDPATPRETVCRLIADSVEVLGLTHEVPLRLLRHMDSNVRRVAVEAITGTVDAWKLRDHLPVIAPLLTDEEAGIAERILTWFRGLGGGIPCLREPAGVYPEGRVRYLDNPDDLIRLEAMFVTAILDGKWGEIPAIAAGHEQTLAAMLTSESLRHLRSTTSSEGFRQALRSAVFARFRSAPVGRRYYECPMVCEFAPDKEAMDLALEELQLRGGAGLELSMFLQRSPGHAKRVLETAFACISRGSNGLQQQDAHGLKALYLANPQAFAVFVAQSKTQRFDVVLKAWRYLPDSREADRLLAQLSEAIEANNPAKKKEEPRRRRSSSSSSSRTTRK